MNARSLLLVLLAGLAPALGCDPNLPLPASDPGSLSDGGTGAGGGAGSIPSGLSVAVEPPAPILAAPPVLRLHVAFPGLTLDPTRIFLVQGSLGVEQTHELYNAKVSATLEKRILGTLSWPEGSGEVIAPTASLTAGATYTLVIADVPAALEVLIAPSDAAPLLARLWPPLGGSGTTSFAVWCGDDALPWIDTPATPAPAGRVGYIERGAVTLGAGARCVRFEPDPGSAGAEKPSVPPPAVSPAADPAVLVRLDPRPLRVDAPPLPMSAALCVPGEVSFGPGCATVEDDRILARSAGVPLLWAVGGDGTDTVVAAGPGDPFMILGLRPSTRIKLDVAAVDTAGYVLRSSFAATTLPPMAHVVINEVLAYPLGPSPAQEWVELLNDGVAPAELGGYVLVVGSGVTPLPAATLAPGAFALVVDQEFMAGGGLDVAPAPRTLLLRVPHLGKEGLSKEGEVFVLMDPAGSTVSSFPAKPRPKQGSSVARRTPSSPDALPGSFALAAPTPGWTNTW
jgi:hypothetical protein